MKGVDSFRQSTRMRERDAEVDVSERLLRLKCDRSLQIVDRFGKSSGVR